MSTPSANIVWADVETDGLKVRGGHLLEVAALVTDAELNILDPEGYQAVVRYSEAAALGMRRAAHPYVREMHDKTGLWEDLHRKSGNAKPLSQIDAELHAYIAQFGAARTMPLGGNSVRLDFNFIEEFLPSVYAHLDYHMIDVSTVAGLAHRWYEIARPVKASDHTAMTDIKASIEELRYYREYTFRDVAKPVVSETEIEAFLRGIGLTDQPEEYGDGIHSWRCEHPDRYGRCNCFAEVVADLMKLIREGKPAS